MKEDSNNLIKEIVTNINTLSNSKCYGEETYKYKFLEDNILGILLLCYPEADEADFQIDISEDYFLDKNNKLIIKVIDFLIDGCIPTDPVLVWATLNYSFHEELKNSDITLEMLYELANCAMPFRYLGEYIGTLKCIRENK